MSQHYALPLSVFDGGKAVTTQFFTELNVKGGTQFEAADYVAASTIEDLIFQTGNQPVIIKAVIIQIDGDGMFAQWFAGPTFDQADLDQTLTPHNLNAESSNTAAMTINRIADTDVTADGTAKSPQIPIIGSNTPGSASTPTSDITPLERVLAANTTYLLRRKGLTQGQSAQQSAFYVTWHEGELSVNNPLDPRTGRI